MLGPRDAPVTLLGAVLVGILAALVPLRSVLAVDPATAFRPADANPATTSRHPVGYSCVLVVKPVGS
ncbi:MAG: ABC transporter permease [Acidimicrobiales bacterium]